MTGLLFYFSGTGNTKWAADKFKEKFENEGCSLSLINTEDTSFDFKALNNCDFIIFGFPVHAECAPRIFMDFLKRMPSASSLENKNIKCIVYCTLAADNAAGLKIVSKKLRKKGYNVQIEIPITLWSNCFFAFGAEKSKKEMDNSLAKAEAAIDSCVQMFLNEEKKSSPVSQLRKSSAILVEKLYYRFLPLFTKNFNSTNECKACGLCVKKCPRHNITIENNHAVFGRKCIMCCRCIHLCPANAILYKDKKINQTQKEYIK